MGRTKANVVKEGVSATLKKGPATISLEEQVAKIAYGNTVVSFDNKDAYMEYLGKKEDTTSRAQVGCQDVKFFVPTQRQIDAMVKQGYPLELINDTLANSGMCVKIDGKMYPVNMAAMPNIKRMVFQRWDAVDAKVKVPFINATICASESVKQVQDSFLSSICNGALYSIMTGVYSPIVSQNFVGRVFEVIGNTVGEYELVQANCSIATYRVAVKFTGERAQEMEELYKSRILELADRRGITIDQKVLDELSISFGVSIVNNDNGEDAATVTPIFNLGKNIGFRCPDDKAVKYTAYHKGILSFDNFDTKVENMFAMFENFVTKLSSKIITDIKNWRVVMTEACKELAVPDPVTNKLIVEFAKVHGQEIVTAYDICMAILDSIAVYKAEQDPSENALENYEARIAGIVNLDLAKWDFDPQALENELKSQFIANPINALEGAMIELGIIKSISKSVIAGFETKMNMEQMLNGGQPVVTTSWDLYQAILGAASIYRDFLANRKMKGDRDKRAASFEKNLQKARDICYPKYDVA